ncbi:MAG: hypothetical protein ACKVQU_10620 [Burkholderiales bacterium]
MTADLQEVKFNGGILRRGFWLYVWEITPPEGAALYYVGRTGDSSSTNAQSPFNRMGQHLGFAENSNMLRRHLGEHGFEPERCMFRPVALGPLEEESKAESRHEHDDRRDRVAALEKALAETLTAAGCRVMNRVASRKPLDSARFAEVRGAFETAFPHLVRQVAAALPGAAQ